jgi:hypothetical protein
VINANKPKTIMKKLFLSIVAAALCVGCVHAQNQTVPAAPSAPVAVGATNTAAPDVGLQLTPDQVAKLNGNIDSVLPLIPAAYTPLALKILGWIGTLALLGRVIVGWRNNGLFGVIAGLFGGTNTPKNNGTANGKPPGALLLLALALPACLLFTGCGTIPHQYMDNESGTGLKAKIPVGYNGNNIFELDLTIGTFKHTGIIQPVETNRLYSPSIVVAAATRGIFQGGQALGAGNGTNIVSSNPIANVKGGDSYIVTTGHAEAGVTNNADASAASWQDEATK